MARRPRRLDRALERRQRHPRVAARSRRQQLDRVLVDLRRVGDPTLGIRQRPSQQLLDLGRSQGRQLVDLRSREQRRVDLEVGVLGGRADQRHQALLDGGKERVLLRLVEAMDLVEEEDRRLVRSPAALLGARDHRPDLGAPGVDRRLLLERPTRSRGDDPRQGGLARARRAVQHCRVRLAGFDRGAKRRVGAQQVRLADKLVERSRPHPHRQRRLRRRHSGPLALVRVVGVKQSFHLVSVSRPPWTRWA